jgi:hypothetical protein
VSSSAPKLFSRSESNATVRGFVLRSEIIFAFGAGINFFKKQRDRWPRKKIQKWRQGGVTAGLANSGDETADKRNCAARARPVLPASTTKMYASRSQSVSSRSTASTQVAPATSAIPASAVPRVYTWDDVFDEKNHDFEVCILLASLLRFSTHG